MMQKLKTFTDQTGRVWQVHEIVGYSSKTPDPDAFPKVVRSAIVFESGGERRKADDVPLDWSARPDALSALFARAQLLNPDG